MATNLEFVSQYTINSTVTSAWNIGSTSNKLFTTQYDVYLANLTMDGSTTNSETIKCRLIDASGNVISGSEYDNASWQMFAHASFGEERGTNESEIQDIWGTYDKLPEGLNSSIYIYNPANSSSYTFLQGSSSNAFNGNFKGHKSISVHKNAEEIIGIQFFVTNTDYFLNAKFTLYGVK
mgnify:CR=1 FL=1|tara:strand:- start:445 stop:981 length:537 start_codon:yes stop_codon:yes gene_type:complete